MPRGVSGPLGKDNETLYEIKAIRNKQETLSENRSTWLNSGNLEIMLHTKGSKYERGVVSSYKSERKRCNNTPKDG